MSLFLVENNKMSNFKKYRQLTSIDECSHTSDTVSRHSPLASMTLNTVSVCFILLRFGIRVQYSAVRCGSSSQSGDVITLSTYVISAGECHVVQRRRPAAVVDEDSLISGGSYVIGRLAIWERPAGWRRDVRVCGVKRFCQATSDIFSASHSHRAWYR